MHFFFVWVCLNAQVLQPAEENSFQEENSFKQASPNNEQGRTETGTSFVCSLSNCGKT
jgi:hypothetical protein